MGASQWGPGKPHRLEFSPGAVVLFNDLSKSVLSVLLSLRGRKVVLKIAVLGKILMAIVGHCGDAILAPQNAGTF